jgi:DNA-binding MarR family transcriptional regulator
MTRRQKQFEREEARQAGEVCACFNLRKAARAVTQLYDEAFRGSGLRATQHSLLTVLLAGGDMSVTDLAEVAVMDRTTLTRNLRLLEKQGLIRIQPGVDRRVRQVGLTRKGHDALERLFPLWDKAQTEMTNGLGKERLGRLLSDLSATVAMARQE